MFAAPAVQAGLAVAILVVVIAVAFWLLERLRDYTTQDRLDTTDALANLEEMLRKGDISEAEFRTIQASARRSGDSSSKIPNQATLKTDAESDSDTSEQHDSDD
ncbi:MAG: hypothetical protein AB8B91_02685 [Rubripirellula sp.]